MYTVCRSLNLFLMDTLPLVLYRDGIPRDGIT